MYYNKYIYTNIFICSVTYIFVAIYIYICSDIANHIFVAIFVAWLITRVTWLIRCVTWFGYMCDTTHSYVWHDLSSPYASTKFESVGTKFESVVRDPLQIYIFVILLQIYICIATNIYIMLQIHRFVNVYSFRDPLLEERIPALPLHCTLYQHNCHANWKLGGEEGGEGGRRKAIIMTLSSFPLPFSRKKRKKSPPCLQNSRPGSIQIYAWLIQRCATRLSYMCAMTHPYERRDSFKSASKSSFTSSSSLHVRVSGTRVDTASFTRGGFGAGRIGAEPETPSFPAPPTRSSYYSCTSKMCRKERDVDIQICVSEKCKPKKR